MQCFWSLIVQKEVIVGLSQCKHLSPTVNHHQLLGLFRYKLGYLCFLSYGSNWLHLFESEANNADQLGCWCCKSHAAIVTTTAPHTVESVPCQGASLRVIYLTLLPLQSGKGRYRKNFMLKYFTGITPYHVSVIVHMCFL